MYLHADDDFPVASRALDELGRSGRCSSHGGSSIDAAKIGARYRPKAWIAESGAFRDQEIRSVQNARGSGPGAFSGRAETPDTISGRSLRLDANSKPSSRGAFCGTQKSFERCSSRRGDTPFETPATRAPLGEGTGFPGVTVSEPSRRKPYDDWENATIQEVRAPCNGAPLPSQSRPGRCGPKAAFQIQRMRQCRRKSGQARQPPPDGGALKPSLSLLERLSAPGRRQPEPGLI
jgi:hypothetical protein